MVIVLPLLLAAGGFIVQGCDSLPLTAPGDSSLSLHTSSTFAELGGSVELTAIVTEEAGTPVHNGTSVTFTTTLGTLEPAQAHTNDGRATSRLRFGNEAGIAFVEAFSGEATIDGEPLEIRVGAAAATTVTLAVNPSSLPSGGGTATVIALVTDDDNRRLPDVPVTFTATAGTLGSSRVVTNQNGEARTTITTTRETEITATIGEATATETLAVNDLPQISVTVSPAGGVVETDDVVTFDITIEAQENGSPVREASISFGDGGSQSLGALNGSTTITHQYTSPGAYTVRITATDTAGEHVEQVLTVTAVEPEEGG
ncbi:MAG: Ig-like domain-containing protein [Vicinamibacteraceae bacterium]